MESRGMGRVATDNPGWPVKRGAATVTAERLRAMIASGAVQPGQRLDEERVRDGIGVSRSTLREAFRLLIQDRLLEHHFSRGVFVRRLSRADIQDIYRTRRIVECAALASVEVVSTARLRSLSDVLARARKCVEVGDWEEVASASIAFHALLVSLAESGRLDRLIEQVLAEFRLAYGQMVDTQRFHVRFLERNGVIADLIRNGDIAGAVAELNQYLYDAEAELLAMVQ